MHRILAITGLGLLLNSAPAQAAHPETTGTATAAVAILVGICVAAAGWLMVRRQTAMVRQNRLLAEGLKQAELMLGRGPVGWLAWSSSGEEFSSPHLIDWFGGSDESGFAALISGLETKSAQRLSSAAEALRQEDRPFVLTVQSRGCERTFEARGEVLDGIDLEALRHVLWLNDVTQTVVATAAMEQKIAALTTEGERLTEALDSTLR